MKVIKLADLPEEPPSTSGIPPCKVVCCKCRSMLEVTAEDVDVVYGSDFRFKCCVCSGCTTVRPCSIEGGVERFRRALVKEHQGRELYFLIKGLRVKQHKRLASEMALIWWDVLPAYVIAEIARRCFDRREWGRIVDVVNAAQGVIGSVRRVKGLAADGCVPVTGKRKAADRGALARLD